MGGAGLDAGLVLQRRHGVEEADGIGAAGDSNERASRIGERGVLAKERPHGAVDAADGAAFLLHRVLRLRQLRARLPRRFDGGASTIRERWTAVGTPTPRAAATCSGRPLASGSVCSSIPIVASPVAGLLEPQVVDLLAEVVAPHFLLPPVLPGQRLRLQQAVDGLFQLLRGAGPAVLREGYGDEVLGLADQRLERWGVYPDLLGPVDMEVGEQLGLDALQ